MITGTLLTISKLVIGFIALVVVINLSGKNSLSSSSTTAQTGNYILAGSIGAMLYNDKIEILEYLITLLIWLILVVLVNKIKRNFLPVKQLLDGKAIMIINDGELLVANCKKAGLSAYDVALKLRLEGIYSIADVNRAFVEQNGHLTISQYGDENPKFPLITDGQVHLELLELIGQSEEWLLAEIRQAGYQTYSDIFLGEYRDGKINLVGRS